MLPVPHSQSNKVRVEESQPDSDSDDFSPTPSLAEISSDDLSWLEDNDPGENFAKRRRQHSHLTALHLQCVVQFAESHHMFPSYRFHKPSVPKQALRVGALSENVRAAHQMGKQ